MRVTIADFALDGLKNVRFAFCLSALNAAFEKTVDFLAVHKILVKLVEAFGFS